MNTSMNRSYGYKCPIRGCTKKSRRFGLTGIVMHMVSCHGIKEVENRLRIKQYARK